MTAKPVTAVALAVLALIVVACAGSAVPTTPRPTADDDLQAKRQKVIDGYRDAGVIQKTEVTDKSVRLWVRPAFYALDFDDKESLANVVWAWAFSVPKTGLAGHPAGTLFVYDSKSGKIVGTYRQDTGFTMD